MPEREEERGDKPFEEDEGKHGLGSKTGGLGGPDEPERQEGGTSPGGDAEEGPVKGETSEEGGGDATGPTPSGVPQEGDTDPDADTSTGST